jgi:hypothetical protein
LVIKELLIVTQCGLDASANSTCQSGKVDVYLVF